MVLTREKSEPQGAPIVVWMIWPSPTATTEEAVVLREEVAPAVAAPGAVNSWSNRPNTTLRIRKKDAWNVVIISRKSLVDLLVIIARHDRRFWI